MRALRSPFPAGRRPRPLWTLLLLLSLTAPAAIVFLSLRDGPPAVPEHVAVDARGRPPAELEREAARFVSALAAGDRATLTSMSGGSDRAVAALLRSYGRHPARATEYAEDSYGLPTVRIAVACGDRRVVEFVQLFHWVDGGPAAVIEEPWDPAAPPGDPSTELPSQAPVETC